MTDELRKILTDNDLMALIPVLEKQRINDIEIIAELNESDLEKIGIDKLGDRKKIIKIFSKNIFDNREHTTGKPQPAEVVVRHSTMAGQDASSGFGRGFGETVGEKAGGCVWSGCAWLIGIIVIVIIIAVILGNI